LIAELINTGTELLLGRVQNTHQQWLCRRLADLGHTVSRQTLVADAGPDIQAAVREALGRADVVITTGGLGPTSDDATREMIAQLLGRPLRENAALVGHIQSFFAARKRPMPARTRVQALVPEGALVLPNPHGTACGLALEVAPNPFRPDAKTSWLILLPGPPRELQPMFSDAVVPLLRQGAPPPSAFACRTLRSVGLGESLVEEKIAGALRTSVGSGLEVGYCARPGEVDIRLAARGPGAEQIVREAEQTVRGLIGRHIFGAEEDSLESVIVDLLAQKGRTLALAESCTGGCIAHRITNVPGASAVFLGGMVTYSDQAKIDLLGVSPELLARHGAVSEPTAREMAEGARRRFKAGYALAVTGIAGPAGGTDAKPVGTVFIALASDRPTVVLHPLNPYDRETFKQVTAQQALELLRRILVEAA
jgi:nicotinamide-nucleotide amidase